MAFPPTAFFSSKTIAPSETTEFSGLSTLGSFSPSPSPSPSPSLESRASVAPRVSEAARISETSAIASESAGMEVDPPSITPISRESALESDIIGLVHQHLVELGLDAARHALERETKYYFDMAYVRTLFIQGQWDELTTYLSSFLQTSRSSDHSLLYFEILKHKFLDALDRSTFPQTSSLLTLSGNKTVAASILTDEIRTFFQLNETNMVPSAPRVKLYNEFASLLTFSDFRKHSNLVWLKDGPTTREHVYPQLEHFLRTKLTSVGRLTDLPPIPEPSRLKALLNQAVEFHKSTLPQQREHPAVVQTYFVNHDYFSPEAVTFGNLAFSQRSLAPLEELDPLPVSLPPLAPPSDPTLTTATLVTGRSGSDLAPYGELASDSLEGRFMSPDFAAPPQYRHPSPSSKSKSKKRGRPPGSKNKNPKSTKQARLDSHPTSTSSSAQRTRPPARYSPPSTLAATLPTSITPVKLAFHPSQRNLLVVASATGELELWDVIARRLLSQLTIADVDNVFHLSWCLKARYIVIVSRNGGTIVQLDAQSSLKLYKRIVTSDSAICAQSGFLPKEAHSKVARAVLSIGLEDGTVQVFDLDTGELNYIFTGHTVSLVRVSPSQFDNQAALTTVCIAHLRTNPILVTTSLDGTMRAWTFPYSYPLIKVKPGEDGENDEEKSAASEANGSKTADPLAGVIPKPVPMPFPISVTKESTSFTLASTCRSMLFHHRRLFSCGADVETFVEWNAKSGRVKVKFDEYQPNSSAVLLPSGSIIMAVTDGTASLYSSVSGVLLHTMPFAASVYSLTHGGEVIAVLHDESLEIYATHEKLALWSSSDPSPSPQDLTSHSTSIGNGDSVTSGLSTAPSAQPSPPVTSMDIDT